MSTSTVPVGDHDLDHCASPTPTPLTTPISFPSSITFKNEEMSNDDATSDKNHDNSQAIITSTSTAASATITTTAAPAPQSTSTPSTLVNQNDEKKIIILKRTSRNRGAKLNDACEYWIDESTCTLHTRIHRDSSDRPGHHYHKRYACMIDAQEACLHRIEAKIVHEGFTWIVDGKRRVFPIQKLKNELRTKRRQQLERLNAYKSRIESGQVVLPRLRSPQAKRSLVYGRYGLKAPPSRGTVESIFKMKMSSTSATKTEATTAAVTETAVTATSTTTTTTPTITTPHRRRTRNRRELQSTPTKEETEEAQLQLQQQQQQKKSKIFYSPLPSRNTLTRRDISHDLNDVHSNDDKNDETENRNDNDDDERPRKKLKTLVEPKTIIYMPPQSKFSTPTVPSTPTQTKEELIEHVTSGTTTMNDFVPQVQLAPPILVFPSERHHEDVEQQKRAQNHNEGDVNMEDNLSVSSFGDTSSYSHLSCVSPRRDIEQELAVSDLDSGSEIEDFDFGGLSSFDNNEEDEDDTRWDIERDYAELEKYIAQEISPLSQSNLQKHNENMKNQRDDTLDNVLPSDSNNDSDIVVAATHHSRDVTLETTTIALSSAQDKHTNVSHSASVVELSIVGAKNDMCNDEIVHDDEDDDTIMGGDHSQSLDQPIMSQKAESSQVECHPSHASTSAAPQIDRLASQSEANNESVHDIHNSDASQRDTQESNNQNNENNRDENNDDDGKDDMAPNEGNEEGSDDNDDDRNDDDKKKEDDGNADNNGDQKEQEEDEKQNEEKDDQKKESGNDDEMDDIEIELDDSENEEMVDTDDDDNDDERSAETRIEEELSTTVTKPVEAPEDNVEDNDVKTTISEPISTTPLTTNDIAHDQESDSEDEEEVEEEPQRTEQQHEPERLDNNATLAIEMELAETPKQIDATPERPVAVQLVESDEMEVEKEAVQQHQEEMQVSEKREVAENQVATTEEERVELQEPKEREALVASNSSGDQDQAKEQEEAHTEDMTAPSGQEMEVEDDEEDEEEEHATQVEEEKERPKTPEIQTIEDVEEEEEEVEEEQEEEEAQEQVEGERMEVEEEREGETDESQEGDEAEDDETEERVGAESEEYISSGDEEEEEVSYESTTTTFTPLKPPRRQLIRQPSPSHSQSSSDEESQSDSDSQSEEESEGSGMEDRDSDSEARVTDINVEHGGGNRGANLRMEQLIDEIEELNGQVQAKERKITTLQKRLIQLNAIIEESDTSQQALTEDIVKKEEVIENLRSECERLRAIEQTINDIDALQRQMKDKESEIEKKMREMSELETNLRSRSEQVEKDERSIAERNESLATRTTALDKREQECTVERQRLEKWNQELSDRSKRLDELQTSLNAQMSSVKQSETELRRKWLEHEAEMSAKRDDMLAQHLQLQKKMEEVMKYETLLKQRELAQRREFEKSNSTLQLAKMEIQAQLAALREERRNRFTQ